MKTNSPEEDGNRNKQGGLKFKRVVEDCDTDIDQTSNKVAFKTRNPDRTLNTTNASTVKEQLSYLKITEEEAEQGDSRDSNLTVAL